MENIATAQFDCGGSGLADAPYTHFYRVVVMITEGARKRRYERHEIQARSRKDAIRCALETCGEDIRQVTVMKLRDATDEENESFAYAVQP